MTASSRRRGATPPPVPAASFPLPLPGKRLKNAPFVLVATFWVLMLFEVDVFLSAKLGVPFYRIPLLIAPILAGLILIRWDRRALNWPLVVFTVLHLGASVFAANAGLSRGPFKYLAYILLFFAGSVIYADSPAKIKVLLKILLLSYVWFGFQGLLTGKVAWHPLIGNEDSFGPLMVLLLPLAYFYSQATSSPKWRWIARGAFVIALTGVVVSFARGAALTAALVLVYIVFRSRQRIRFLGLLAVTVGIGLPIVLSVFPVSSYIAEIASSGQGDPARTGLWMAAVRVFTTSPVFGVGAGNFGVVANEVAHDYLIGLDFPSVYFLTVHNPNFQILAEEGLIGITVWLIMLLSILRWNRRLRRRDAQAAWDRRGGEGLNLRLMSFGLEGLLIAFLGNSIFYNQLYIHWVWSLLTISYLLYQMAGGHPAALRKSRGQAPGAYDGSGLRPARSVAV